MAVPFQDTAEVSAEVKGSEWRKVNSWELHGDNSSGLTRGK